MLKIPVLAYHSANIAGNDYHNNDHTALSHDLETINRLGYQIIPANWLVDWLAGRRDLDQTEYYVVLTFDDGVSLDFHDWVHPEHGLQKSFFNILKQFSLNHPKQQPNVHASSFVIASRQARENIQEKALSGHPLLSDDWWIDAEKTPFLSIENHSLDHNHPDCEITAQKDGITGSFGVIDSYDECDQEVRQASEFIHGLIERKSLLYAYPWGQYSEYIANEYFPDFQYEHHIKAAFTTEPETVHSQTNQWLIPRYVCGEQWKSPEQLIQIIHHS
ncbi:MAG: polysaccharide deacetylase family protein [Methylococcales bacterium]